MRLGRAGVPGSTHAVHIGWPWSACGGGKAVGLGSAFVAAASAGATAALLLPIGVCVPAAHGLAALSLLGRAGTAAGRVRLRLTLLAVSVAAGGLHHLVLAQLPSTPGEPVGRVHVALQLLAVTGIALCLVAAITALVIAVADGGTTLIWLRRVLDGWMIAGSLLTLCWLLLRRADQSGDVLGSLQDLARVVTDILVFGLLVALRHALKRPERTATTVGALALAVLSASDMLRILMPAPGTWYGIPCAAACSITGLLLIAVAPWLAGGTSVVDVEKRIMPVIGVVAAFVPVAVCALAPAVHTLFGGHTDMMLTLLAGSLLVALGTRQGIIHADHLHVTREATTREALYRTLVDGTRDVITIVSLDGRVRYVSPAAYHVFGYRPEELTGARLPLYCHPDDVTALMQAVDALREEAVTGIRGPGRRVPCRVRHADGRWRHVESTVSHHPQGMIFSSRDVTDRVTLHQQLEHLAFHDPLTGLANRALFTDRVAHALCKRTTHAAPPAVLFVDLDGFKAVNDTAGHAAGDALLILAARRLKASVRAADTVARLGGDEFAALLEGEAATHPARVQDVAERVLTALIQPYHIAGNQALVSASIGMAIALPGITPDELLHQADQAMYQAKKAGKGRIHLHTPPPHQTHHSPPTEPTRQPLPPNTTPIASARLTASPSKRPPGPTSRTPPPPAARPTTDHHHNSQ